MSSPAILTLIAAILLTPGISASASQVYLSHDRWVTIGQSEASNCQDWPIRGRYYVLTVPILRDAHAEMNWILLWQGTMGTRLLFFGFITFEICWIKPAANIPTINERTKANGRGRGRGDGAGIDGKWYYDFVVSRMSAPCFYELLTMLFVTEAIGGYLSMLTAEQARRTARRLSGRSR